MNSEEIIALIKERSPQKITANYEKAINSLWRFCGAEDMDISFIESKLGLFQNYFEKYLFNSVIHRSNYKINGENIILKSPEALGGQYSASGEPDIEIGNTNYVFASFEKMPTALASGRYTYSIQVEESDMVFVVPMDIHDLAAFQDINKAREVYSENIFSYKDFKHYFSLFSAILFDSVEDVVPVLLQIHKRHYLDTPDVWQNPERIRGDYLGEGIEVDVTEVFTMIKKLLSDYHLMPPVSPEIQFKDQVKANFIYDS